MAVLLMALLMVLCGTVHPEPGTSSSCIKEDEVDPELFDCKITAVGQYLKEMCNSTSGKTYYKCVNSDQYYTIDMIYDKIDEECEGWTDEPTSEDGGSQTPEGPTSPEKGPDGGGKPPGPDGEGQRPTNERTEGTETETPLSPEVTPLPPEVTPPMTVGVHLSFEDENDWEDICYLKAFSAVCENDPEYYQICGHYMGCLESPPKNGTLCGQNICPDYAYYYTDTSKVTVNVGSIVLEEYDETCGVDEDEKYDNDTNIVDLWLCAKSSGTDDRLKLWCGNPRTCDDCTLIWCETEDNCYSETGYGILCYVKLRRLDFITSLQSKEKELLEYVEPQEICDSKYLCMNGEDEPDTCESATRQCTYDVMVASKDAPRKGKRTIKLVDENSCTPFPICSDYSDQFDCKNHSLTPLICSVKGVERRISKFMVCAGKDICDDNIDSECWDCGCEVGCEITEILHKHQYCDGVSDCVNGMDEDLNYCSMSPVTCERKLANQNRTNSTIPYQWINDGLTDCVGGEDEMSVEYLNATYHIPICGAGATARLNKDDETCSEVFRCPDANEHFVHFDDLCDRVSSCGNEIGVCSVSRGITSLWTQITTKEFQLLHCLYGLESLAHLKGNCTKEAFASHGSPYGVDPLGLTLPEDTSLDCRYVFGELYVYLSCTGRCANASCPLDSHVLKADSCEHMHHDRKYTLARDPRTDDQYITFVYEQYKSENVSYRNDIFPCANGKCITYDKVCNLADDCGDKSDEATCANHFQCSNPESYIPISSQCDGKFDCGDLSDECNGECDTDIINDAVLAVAAWSIGVTALLMNILAVIFTSLEITKAKSVVKKVNLICIFLISLGDFLVGGYLVAIALIDSIYKGEGDLAYCLGQLDWMSSGYCASLGVISTFGSLLSLYAMTILSLFRLYSVKQTGLRGGLTTNLTIALITMVFFLMFIPFIISVIPLMNPLEDAFVNGLIYTNVPLFIGAISKHKHFNVILAYSGGSTMKDHDGIINTFKWEHIRKLISKMFSTDYGGVSGKKLHFYGNDGVCMFKYFVKDDDPQKMFSWTILMTNALCFFIITISYIFINFIVENSAGKTKGQKKQSTKSRNFQRRITLMITTDFLCWVPFIVTCVLNYAEVLDATPWYALFSVVILPINSVINPLLYDNSGIVDLIKRNRTIIYNSISVKLRRKSTLVVANPAIPMSAVVSTDVAGGVKDSGIAEE